MRVRGTRELLRELLLAELGAGRHVLAGDALAQRLHDVGDRRRASASSALAGAALGLKGDDPA